MASINTLYGKKTLVIIVYRLTTIEGFKMVYIVENGKTYLACALGHAACRKFRTVKYIRVPELLDELSIAKGCGIFKKTIKSYKKVDLHWLSLREDGSRLP